MVVYGAQCESLAESLEPHDVVLVTGKLSWTKKTTKDGEKSGLAVTTFGVEVLVKAEGPDKATVAAERIPADEPTPEPQPKVRRRSYPKAALQGRFSQNEGSPAV